jgi:hypothetical protein
MMPNLRRCTGCEGDATWELVVGYLTVYLCEPCLWELGNLISDVEEDLARGKGVAE